MFKHYLYVSGTSQTLKDYFKWFAQFAYNVCYQRNTLYKPKTFLDIACNDGTQLDVVREIYPTQLMTFGIDPARNLFEKTSKNHVVICDYLNENSVKALLGEAKSYGEGPFDIINAQNVFAHNDNPMKFLECCREMMHGDSFLFIQNSQTYMIENGEFDTMYHEHISFWNMSSMSMVAAMAGLRVVDRIRVPVHGVSDLFILQKKNIFEPFGYFRADNALAMENLDGMHNLSKYVAFGYKADEVITEFAAALEMMRQKHPNFLFVGFGAAAKGNTFLNAGNFKLDYVIDENPLKQGLYTPGTHIPIVGPELLQTNNNLVVIPLAWNFKEEIFKKIKAARPNRIDHYITYFPKVNTGII
jgi:SAM-dependent methyltransferase